MNHPPIGIQHGLVHHLAECRMREHGFDQFRLGRLQRAPDDIALDQLGHFSPDHMRAQQLTRLRVEDGLDDPLCLAQRNGLAVADEGEAADADVMPCRLCLFLGQADASDLRVAIGAAAIDPGLIGCG